MIECYDLIKIYVDKEHNIQVPALRGCDFRVSKGEFVSIIGPSGSGKTTLINIIAGLETISSGKLHVAGYKLETISPKELQKYRLGIVSVVDQFPERSLFPNTTVIDNLIFFFSLQNGRNIPSIEKIRIFMDKLGLVKLENRLVKTLSGGEMTRLAIACALAKKTPILLCDEPTGQLDAKNTDKIKTLLREISDEYNTTIIVVSHDMRFLEGVDKTYEILDGRVSSILTQEERETQTSFPLKIKSHIDLTRSVRIPEVIYDSLKLNTDVIFNVSENSEVKLLHPDKIPPNKIELKEESEVKKSINLKSIPSNYSNSKMISIRVENLSKTYKEQNTIALSDINLTFYKGEIIFIIGSSGSGKTTLLKLLTGLEDCTSGNIWYDELAFNKLTAIEKAKFRIENFGLVSQQGNLHPFITIQENLLLKNIFSSKDFDINIYLENTIENLLTQYHIQHRKNAYPIDISGGELQRASIAVALTNNPLNLFFDEPTANLDSELANNIITEIYKLNKQEKLTILIATHDLSLIRSSSRVIELIDGKVNRDGIFEE